jgi:hypothetical protein
MSFENDGVYGALLAVAAVHRASLLACKDNCVLEARRFQILGIRAYGNVLQLLPDMLRQNSVDELRGLLAVLLLLAYFEVCSIPALKKID